MKLRFGESTDGQTIIPAYVNLFRSTGCWLMDDNIESLNCVDFLRDDFHYSYALYVFSLDPVFGQTTTEHTCIFKNRELLDSKRSLQRKWTYIDVDYDYLEAYNKGLGPIDKSYIRGEAKACESLEVYLNEDSDKNNFVFYQIYYGYSYTAMLDGSSYVTWEFGTVLDCSTWKPFWFSWEGNVHSMGFGLEPGVDTYLTYDLGRTFPIKIVQLATSQSYVTGQWRWLTDEPPLFNLPAPGGYEILEISEDTAQYTPIYTTAATDPEGDTVSVTSTGDNINMFEIYSGILYTMQALDYETENFYVVTFQADDGRNQEKTSMIIKLTNVIDVAPVITIHSVSIPEELPLGTDIGKAFTFTDDEEDDSWTFSFTGTNAEYLSVDSPSTVTMKEVIDIDTTSVDFSGLSIVVMDSASNYDTKVLDITIIDINDNAPTFTSDYYTAAVDEGTGSGQTAVTVGVTDADISNAGLTTSILSQNGATSGFDFTISGNDINTASTMDYEALEGVNFQYVLVVSVVDSPPVGDPLTGTAVVRITVNPANDNSPTWAGTGSYSATVQEDTAVTTVITTLQASDTDLGLDGEITYTILSVTPSKWTYIDVNYDYLEAYNKGLGPIDKSYIRGEAKACESLEVYLNEDSDKNNFVLYQIYYGYSYTAMLDGSSYVTWEFGTVLDCSTWKPFWFSWEGNVHSMGFGLEPGVDTYLTYDLGRTFPINIVQLATSQSHVTGEWRWLTDEPPLFNLPAPGGYDILEISEDTAQYTPIYTPAATDPEGDTVTVTSTGDNINMFEIYSGILYTMQALDYETENFYVVTFQADDGRNQENTSLIIKLTNVIDVAPVVTIHSISIPEELPLGTDIGKAFTFTDDEDDDSWTFSFTGTNAEYLNVDSASTVTMKEVIDIDTTSVDFSGLNIVVMDSASNYDSKVLDITIIDINDNAPTFTSDYYTAEVYDGTGSGHTAVTVGVTDADISNAGLTTSILSQNGATFGFDFTISGNDINTASTLDYEALEGVNFQYVLVVSVVDSPPVGDPLTGTAVVRITVEPENEHVPSWLSTPTPAAEISENNHFLTVVTQLEAIDSDLGSDGQIIYTITSVYPSSGTGLFTVDSTGQVKVGGALDADAGTGGVSSYAISIRAWDKGTSPKYVDGSVSVTVTGANDNAPHFDASIIQASLSEGGTLNSVVTQITANDHDGDSVTLSIHSGGDGHFTMDGDSLKYTSAVDYETKDTHLLIIKATDGTHDSYVSVEVSIVDVVDEPPVISVVSSSTMAEEQAVGSAVYGGYVVTDPDQGDTHSYALSGTHASYIRIDSSTGGLTVSQNVDLESGLTQLDLSVTVTDTSGLTATQAFSITVEDINDLPPVFSPSVYTVEITENTAGDTSLADLTCSDGDTGNNALFDVTVASGDGGAGIFKMSGLQLLTDSTPTDYEAVGSSGYMYTLVITAVDTPDQGEANTGTAIVKVTVKPENEFDPVWRTTVSEGAAPGTAVTSFTATDADLGDDGVISYSIASVTAASGTSAPDKFSIASSTGELMVAGELDVDTGTNGESSYTVVIRASDKGATARTLDGSIVVTLTNVNDNAPTFDQTDYTASVSEASAVGTAVIALNTEDFDGDAVTLSVASGRDDLFECVGNEVKVKAPLDYEADTYHTIIIRASDGVFETDVPVQVKVQDVSDEDPVITMVATATMAEEQALGTGVYGGYLVTDPDAGDTQTYALSGADSGYLSIDSATGELSVAQNVNREGSSGKTQLDLTLTVTDQGGQQVTQAFSITVQDINDLPPVFNPSEFTAEITENAAADVSLLDLTCSDGDTGNNALFDVTVASGDGGAGIFKMNGLQLLTDSTPSDYEALGSSGYMYTLVITAVDKPDQGAPNTGTAIVRVTVKPENEFDPVWTGPASDGSGTFVGDTVSEGEAPGYVITTFQATDADLGVDGEVTYTIVSVTSASGTSASDKFSIASSTGELMVAGELDVDTGTNGESSYTVVVRASDKGATARTLDGSIVVTLTNVNDNAPTFDQTDYTASVSEASAVGTAVIALNTEDFDGDAVTLSVASGRDDLFECVGNEVRIKSGLDYESNTFHVLIIRASDGVFEADVPVQVNVQDASDEVPIITMVAAATMSEEQAIGTGVYGGYVVTDGDDGDALTYSLSGADSAYLVIDSTSGELSIAQNVDRESGMSSLSLTLIATDLAGLQATQDFTITVEDINDLPPTFNPSEYTTEITENMAADTSILDLTLSDGDDGNNAVFTLSVVSGDGGAGIFKMSGQQLQTAATAADYEVLEAAGFVYTLVITAVDTPDVGESNTGTAVVRVTVKPENEFDPVWTAPESGSGTFTGVTVEEDKEPGFVITTFGATDDDIGLDGIIAYSIVSVTGASGATPSDKFAIDTTTGELRIATRLDGDTGTNGELSYTVVVRASDSGTSPRSVDGTIDISVTNVNDNAPVFDQTDYQANVNEDSPVDTVVVSFTPVDHDGDAVTLSISSGRDDLFWCDGYDVKVKGTLDYESETTFVLIMRATDGTFDTDVSLQVNVVDVVDERPAINMISNTSMAEEQTIGTGVYGGYVVTDADAGDTHTYALSGADSAFISIDTSTGDLTVGQNVDRDGGKTELQLTLTVTDQAGLQATQDFKITVEDINDLPPTFSQSVFEVEVTENTAVDTSLLDLTCTDGDSGNNAVITIASIGGDDPPRMDTPDQGAAMTGTAIVKVKVKPENEFDPAWSSPAVDGSGNFDGVTIGEDTTSGTVVVSLTATDDDDGADGDLSYSIVTVTAASGSSADNMFSIDEQTGDVTVAGELDVDTATNGEDSYTLTFRATDKGQTPRTVDAGIVVTLTNVNDNAPVFDQAAYEAIVDEDSAVDTVVITFNVQDHDGDVVTLSVVSGRDDLFSCDGYDVKVKAALDYETDKFYVLVVRASDGKFDTDVSLQVNISDVVDENPVITVATTTSMAEEQAVGTPVKGGYVVTDADEHDVLTYALTGNDLNICSYDPASGDSGFLSINSSTGDLTVTQNVNREGTSGKQQLSLTLTVTDQAGLQATKDFTISVEDINDLPPTFSPSMYEIEVTENTAADTSVLDLICTDDDDGNNGLFDVTVADGDDTLTKFKVSGQQLQTDVNLLDYDSLEASGYMYTLVITAVDTPDQGEANTGTAIVKVTVKPENEFDPVWTSPAIDGSGNFDSITINEDTEIGTAVATLVATDDDSGDDGDVTYSITDVTSQSGATANDLFSINAQTGALMVAGALDVDSGTNGEGSYTVVVAASDNGQTPRSVAGTIVISLSNVNDNAPIFDQSTYQADISEDSAVNTVVKTLNTIDHDGDAVTLSVVSGRSDLFTCDGNDVKVKAGLDFEEESVFVVIINATDGKFQTEVTLQIDLTDVIDEAPVITMATTSSVSEEQTIGTGVDGGYIVTDADKQDALSYTLTGADSAYLSIDSATGDLTVAQNINREGVNAKSALSLRLTVTDQAGLQATQDFTITVKDINDHPPIFNPSVYEIQVTENTAPDTSLLDFTSTDQDDGNNALFDVTVADGDDTLTKFKVSGQQLQTDVNFVDYDRLEASGYMYTLVITAVDTPDQGEANTGTAIVKVTVKPENEFDPVWTGPALDGSGTFTGLSVSEAETPGHVLTTFVATDDDSGDDGTLTYSIVSITAASGATTSGLFAIGERSGEFTVAKMLDADSETGGEGSYSVVVRATDGGTSPRSVEGTITVSLDDANDNAPSFDLTEYKADVEEDKAIGTVVLTMNTLDIDNNDVVSLSIVAGNGDLFEVDGNDVKVKSSLDFETEDSHVLIINATDGKHDTSVSVQVTVLDAIDEPPVITLTSTGSMSEEETVGTGVVAGYVVSDPDAGDTLTYSLTGAASHYLSIDSATGGLSVAENVNRDGTSGRTELNDLLLTVTDQAGLTATQAFTITVKDINDVPPVFDPDVMTTEVTENTAVGTALLDFNCKDDDIGNNAIFTLALSSGDDTDAKFTVSGTQLLTDSNTLDYESTTLEASGYMYTLVITAVDTPDQGEANTGTAIVKVTVKPENEFDPVWTGPASDGSGTFTGASVSEDASLGHVITTFAASDDDFGEDGRVTFSIVSITGASGATAPGTFSIDASAGDLMVASELDTDSGTNGEASYAIVVKASDNGATPRFVEGTITVSLDNVNDNAPVFDKTEYQADLSEDAVADTAVITLNSDDYDGDAVTLSIISGRDDLFLCDGSDVKVKAALNYEDANHHVLVIKASDGTFDAEVSLLINIVDVIDETPVITMVTTGTMAEGQTIGTGVIGGFKVTDADEKDVLTFGLSGADSGYLTIDPATGDLSVAQDIDREAGIVELSLTLTVTDQAGLQATEDFTITVEDVNDSPPICVPAVFSAEVTENSIEDLGLVTLTCTDSDEGNNALFSVSIGSGDDTASPKFKMSGLELLTSSNPLNYELLKDEGYMYTLVITAVDTPDQGEANTGTAIVKVTVKPENEFDPVWSDPVPDVNGYLNDVTVDEDAAPGTAITTVTATDDDQADDGKITYEITSITLDDGSDAAGTFTIGAKTGDLIVKSELDAEGSISFYDIALRAVDGGSTPLEATASIKVFVNNTNDLPPEFAEAKYQTEVLENVTVGSAIFTLEATDLDGDVITYSVDAESSGVFECDGDEIKLLKKLDFEINRYHSVIVSASDGKHTVYVSFIVNVVDVIDEPPSITVADYSIAEEQVTGTVIGNVFSVTDLDVGDVFLYELSGANADIFAINATTGMLSLENRVDSDTGIHTLDQLTLTVTDSGAQVSSVELSFNVLDINDNPPIFSTASYTPTFQEAGANALSLMEFTVTDADIGVNAEYDLTVSAGDDTDPKFSITGTTLYVDSSNVNYEDMVDINFKYTLTVTAIDKPTEGQPLTGITIVTVTVTSKNEFTPEWESPTFESGDVFPAITVPETLPVGSGIANYTATDADEGLAGRLDYQVQSITGSDGREFSSEFTMITSDGVGTLVVSSTLDADKLSGGVDHYIVVIGASDLGDDIRTITGTVTVSLTNEDDPEDTGVTATATEDNRTEKWALRGALMVASAALMSLGVLFAMKIIKKPPKTSRDFFDDFGTLLDSPNYNPGTSP
ncbi:cadherin-23-like [Haliotis rubra]|uniref:cadherin-23-like n=1 Tax=Haliotis rubra TaxID=36100 RepID=UPI001EE5164D|nr:cadherin-23-like [Haliotis rubra]